METKETHISPWLHSIQHTFRTHVLFTKQDECASRFGTTREKINSILNTLYGLEEKWGVNLTSYRERMHYMIAIRDAIGVYSIYHPTHRRREREPNMLWYRYELSPHYKEGSDRLDYFGKDDGITDVGGCVIVSLSHSGIEYLNSIAEGVSYWSSSPDKRYYTTVTI